MTQQFLYVIVAHVGQEKEIEAPEKKNPLMFKELMFKELMFKELMFKEFFHKISRISEVSALILAFIITCLLSTCSA